MINADESDPEEKINLIQFVHNLASPQGPQVPRSVPVQGGVVPLVPLGPQLRLPRQEGRRRRHRRHRHSGRINSPGK